MIFSSSDIGGGRAISGRNGFGVVQADDVSDEGIDRSSDMSISLSAKSSQSWDITILWLDGTSVKDWLSVGVDVEAMAFTAHFKTSDGGIILLRDSLMAL